LAADYGLGRTRINAARKIIEEHYPGGTVDGWLDHIRTRMNRDRIPTAVVALDEVAAPVGTAALTEHDMETHRELSPWLGGVYVIPASRLYERRGRSLRQARLATPLARVSHGS
jgi:hypothetical protein